MTTPETAPKVSLINGEQFGLEKYAAPRLKPETYPGEMSPYDATLMVHNELYEMQFDASTGTFSVEATTGTTSIDTVLEEMALPLMAERLPITVFGSNRCPGQLLDKFKPEEGSVPDPLLNTVIMATGTLKGYDVVYNAKVGQQGYFFADLYRGPETADTEVEVGVIFATPEQLELIDESERLSYDYSLIGEIEVGRHPDQVHAQTKFILPAFAHAGKVAVYADSGHPVALAAIPAKNRGLFARSQTDFQDFFFATADVEAKQRAFNDLPGGPVEANGPNYRKYMGLKRAGGVQSLAERKIFRQALLDAMREEEYMVTDVGETRDLLKVDFDKDILPAFGQIAVINWLAGRR